MLYTLHKRGKSKWKCFRLLSAQIKIHEILLIFETTNFLFIKFCITLQCHETWLFCTFFSWNFIYFQQKEYVKVQIWWKSKCRMSEILHFNELLFSKSYKTSAEKVQKSYLSRHWRMMQNLKETWHVVSNMTWGFCEFSPNHSKSQKFHIDGLFLSKLYEVWAMRSYLSWHLTVMQILNKPWPFGFENGMRNWVHLH